MTTIRMPERGFATFLLLSIFASHLGAQTTPPPKDETIVLNPFEVQTEQARGYQAAGVQSASKLALAIKDVPQTVTVLTSDFLKDISAGGLAEAMSYVSGVVQNGGARNQDGFTIRGFNQPLTYLDGFIDGQEWGSGDNASVAQLEILKGPSTNLYGNARGFGGIINRVTKKPEETAFQSADLTIGSYDYIRATYDTTGPISTDKTWLYRVNAAFTSNDTFRDGIDLRRYFVSPVISKKIGSGTTVMLYLEAMRTETEEDIGIPSVIDPTIAGPFKSVAPNVPLSRNYAENWQSTILEKESARLLVTSQLAEGWTLRLGANATTFNNPIYQVEAVSVAADQRTFNRQAFDLNRWEDHLDQELDLLGKFTTGPFEHNLLAGYEFNREKGRSNVLRKPLPSIDIYNPVYGAPRPDFTGGEASNLLFLNGIYGYFLNDQISMWNDRIQIFGGFRTDRATSHRIIELNAGRGSDTADPANHNTSPRYGFVLKPLPNISLYAQHSEAFVPIFGSTTPDFQALDPQTGKSDEVGLKTTFFNGRLGFDVAVYQITVDGAAIRLDPPLQSFFRNGGQTKGNGTEFNISYNDENWNLIAGFLNQDVRDTIVVSGVPLGAQGQPKNSGNIFAKYSFRDGPFKGFALGGGAVYVGERLFNNSTGKLPEYTRIDLLVSYAFSRKLNVALNATNLFDKDYFFNAASFMLRPGDPRTVRLSAHYDF